VFPPSSFNKASSIAARALRASLKEDKRVAAEKRGATIMRYQKWENGQGGEQVRPTRPARARPACLTRLPAGARQPAGGAREGPAGQRSSLKERERAAAVIDVRSLIQPAFCVLLSRPMRAVHQATSTPRVTPSFSLHSFVMVPMTRPCHTDYHRSHGFPSPAASSLPLRTMLLHMRTAP
jgi:F-type H+-transporting ATPase subunit epsilon